MNYLKKLDDLLYNEQTGLLMALRFKRKEIVEEQQIQEIKRTISKLREQWRDQETIPKLACNIFVDFYPAMESVAALYDDEYSEKVLTWADDIMFEIRSVIC